MPVRPADTLDDIVATGETTRARAALPAEFLRCARRHRATGPPAPRPFGPNRSGTLKDNAIMTTFTVTTLDDFVGADGQHSLREAVNAAAGRRHDPLRRQPGGRGAAGADRGQLTLSHNVTIDGDWDNNGSEVSISGNDASRIFEIAGPRPRSACGTSPSAHGNVVTDGGVGQYAGGAVC